ncbi:FadR/GntR family transcriptional regulator [Mycobacterium colombiense]|uniref:GntR family transcriptional regulator n=1 Tax=Mycobacterium colombiense CECT 3035 TaxID=1041522 RepID=J4TIQ7_9MYCO|nr:FCD domain-containing protein [Mycobacterium colombiense]EJO89423.1 GntR family transcriptional regulator [Mycobacterium colombiense CECT 3035]
MTVVVQGVSPTTPPRPVAGQTLGAALAQRIEQRIRVEGWGPGRLIGSESDLCETFDVGTAAVREAARILEARGVAKARRGPGGGLFVTQPEQSLVTDAARRYLSHAGIDRADLFEVWMALEQLAISKLAASIDPAGAKRLRDLLGKELLEAPRAWTELPNIHLEIARQSDNAALELFIRVLSELTLHTYGATEEPGQAIEWLHARHVELVDAIIAGDAALAQLHLRRFIAAVKRQDFGPAIEREDM